VLDAAMGAGERAAMTAVLRNSSVGSVSRLAVRARREERNAKISRLAVVLALFLVLLIGALLVTCRAVIDSMLQAPPDPRVANKVGDIVFTLPDGAFCRHLSFNNATAELMESSAAPCPEAKPRGGSERPSSHFAWGAR
jgi:hypothetical protein